MFQDFGRKHRSWDSYSVPESKALAKEKSYFLEFRFYRSNFPFCQQKSYLILLSTIEGH